MTTAQTAADAKKKPAARKTAELCKEGDGSKLSKAEQAYQEAVSSLKLVEISTRHTLGVVHTRASFMSLLDKR